MHLRTMRALFASRDAFSVLLLSCIQPQLQRTVLQPGILYEFLRICEFNMSKKESVPDWRSPDAYAYLNELDLAEFAWEFLRRNPDYRRNFRNIGGKPKREKQFPKQSMTHWGLRFRHQSGAARRHCPTDLAAAA